MPIKDIKLDHHLFLDKTIFLYGESDSGKSFFLRDIMYQIRDKISQVFVFVGNDDARKDYVAFGIKPPLIYSSMTLESLQEIWDRQCMIAATYIRANDYDVLESLYERLGLEHVDRYITQARRKRAADIMALKEKYSDEPDRASIDIRDTKSCSRSFTRRISRVMRRAMTA
jgi:hypothetical protein